MIERINRLLNYNINRILFQKGDIKHVTSGKYSFRNEAIRAAYVQCNPKATILSVCVIHIQD